MTSKQFELLCSQEALKVKCRECQFWIRVNGEDLPRRCTNQLSPNAGQSTIGCWHCDGGRRRAK